MPYVFFLITSGNYWAHLFLHEHMSFVQPPSCDSISVTIVLKTHVLDLAPLGCPPASSSFSSHFYRRPLRILFPVSPCSPSLLAPLVIIRYPSLVNVCLYFTYFLDHPIPSLNFLTSVNCLYSDNLTGALPSLA